MSENAPVNASHDTYELYTASPQGARRAFDNRTQLNEQVKGECLTLIRRFAEATGYDLKQAEEAVCSINTKGKLDPSFHAALHRLKMSMKQGDALSGYRNLRWMQTHPLTLNNYGIQIGAPDNSPATVEAITHIHLDETLDVHGRRAEIFATNEADILPYIGEIRSAIKLVSVVDPLMSEEIETLIAKITVVKAQGIMGGSLMRTFGGIFIASPDHDPIRGHAAYITLRGIPYFLEHLVHESSHNVLFGIMHSDPLIENPISERFAAPLRKDLRPMYGIFHAAFVVARMVRVFKLLVQDDHPEYEPLVQHFEPRLRSGIKTITEHGRLTENGKRVFESLEEVAFLS